VELARPFACQDIYWPELGRACSITGFLAGQITDYSFSSTSWFFSLYIRSLFVHALPSQTVFDFFSQQRDKLFPLISEIGLLGLGMTNH